MKLFNLLSSPFAQYIILIFLCLFITSTTSQFTHFNYTESISGKYANSNFYVLNIRTYSDGTSLVHVARNISTSAKTSNFNCSGLNLEPILRIRVIKLNGSVVEINSQDNLNFDPVNFCIINNTLGNIMNPITIYPLREQFILVNYIVAINSSDPTTYEEWGQVIDWNGNSLSKLRYGQSYVNLNKTWIPNSKIQLNVLKNYEFLRAAAIRIGDSQMTGWQQYSVDKLGTLSMYKSDNMSITLEDTSTQQSALLATVDGGYAILNANFTNDDSSLLAKSGGLYASFISYNLSLPIRQAQLYQVTLDNITYNGLYCDYDTLGYICVISVNITNPSTNNQEIYYLKIHFLTSGTVINVKFIKNIPDVTGLSKQSWKMETMPFGGYILENTANNIHYIYAYNEENDTQISSPIQFNTNLFNVNAIMKNNNTLLFASPYTSNSQWSLLNFQLPKLLNRANNYGNIQVSDISPFNGAYVDSSTKSLQITFYKPVLLSTGNLTIYKASNDSERQSSKATITDQVSISPDGLTVSIKVIASTFNEYGEKYYIRMDANFVKDRNLSEPLSGIDKRIVVYESKYTAPSSEEAVNGIAQFTTSATKKFEVLSQDDKTKYFNALLDEISEKLPVRRERLTTDGNFQYVYSQYDKNIKNIQFSIRVNLTDQSQRENTVPGVVSDLDNMIRYKSVTTFSEGLTNDLDPIYGFKTKGGLLGDYGKAIIPMILAASANGVIYFISQTGSAKEANRLNETRNKAGELTENINQKASTFNIKMAANLFSGGLFVFSHSAFSTTFSFSDVNSKPEFKFPSQLFWFIPIALNVAMLIYIIIRKFKDKKIEITSSYSKYLLIILALYNSETSAIINRVKIFDKVKEFENKVKIRAFLDTFIKNVPQLVIQILYFNSIVTYSIIPFLTLCTTVFMICLTCVRSGFDFFKDGKKNANNEDDNEKKDNNWVAKRVNEWINDENVKTENVETENVKTENVKTDNVKTEDVKTEDVKTEDIQ